MACRCGNVAPFESNGTGYATGRHNGSSVDGMPKTEVLAWAQYGERGQLNPELVIFVVVVFLAPYVPGWHTV